MRCIVSSAGR